MIFALGYYINAKAQSIYEYWKIQSPVVQLYKLSPEQYSFLISNPGKADSIWLYNNKVGEIHTDSYDVITNRAQIQALLKGWPNRGDEFTLRDIWKVWENGYYLSLKVNQNEKAEYSILMNPKFSFSVLGIGEEYFVLVSDSAGLPVPDAKVWLDSSKCTWDSSVGGYKIFDRNLKGKITVKKGNDFTIQTFAQSTRQIRGGGKPPRDRYNYSKPFAQGYMVSNKPRYRYGDTVFYKAFLVNKKAKPWKKPVYLSSGHYFKKLKPTEPGAFDGYFVLNDSFSPGMQFLHLMEMRGGRPGRLMKSLNIRLEDYETDEVTTSVQKGLDPSPGTGAKVHFETLTKGGLPVLDGKIKVTLKLLDVQFTDADSVGFPEKWFSSRYEYSTVPDPSGITTVHFHDSLFIPGQAAWMVTAEFLSFDNRTYEYPAIQLQYQGGKDRTFGSMDEDTLTITNRFMGKESARTLTLKNFAITGDLLTTKTIVTPYHEILPYWITRSEVLRGDTLVQRLYHSSSLPEIKGKRTHDSVLIEFKTNRPVFYRIYRNNEMVHGGSGLKLDYRRKDKSKHSYHIQFGFPDATDPANAYQSKSFHLAEREAIVRINTPMQVYPGQKAAVEIVVTDAKGKPLNNVNLTAWAINKQVPGITRPEIPYMGLVKSQKNLPLNPKATISIHPIWPTAIKDWQVNRLNLRQLPYYQLRFPANYAVINDTSINKQTEAEVFVTWKGQYDIPRYVMANDSLIWMQDAFKSTKAYKIKPGKYNFTVRTHGHIFKLKDIQIKPGLKNFIRINTDSMLRQKLCDTIAPGYYRKAEWEMLTNHRMLFRYQFHNNDTLIFKINGDVRFGTPFLRDDLHRFYAKVKAFNPGQQRPAYSNVQEFYSFGPVSKGDKVEIFWKNGYSHEFIFDPAFSYSMTDRDLFKQPIEDALLQMRYFGTNMVDRLNLANHWFDPYYKPSKPAYQPRSIELALPNLPEYQYKDYSPANAVQHALHIYLKNSDRTIQKIWLFNLPDSAYSSLNSNYWNGHQWFQGSKLWKVARQPFYAKPGSQSSKYLMAIKSADTAWLLKTLLLDSQNSYYLTVPAGSFRRLKESEFIWLDRMAKALGKEPLRIFSDTPVIENATKLATYPTKNKTSILECVVAGPGYNYVVNDAFVVLEKDGIFEKGAYTNADGIFRMENLKPGRYMLKIKSAYYHYWISYSVNIEAGKLHIGRLVLKPLPNYIVAVSAGEAFEPGPDISEEKPGRTGGLIDAVAVRKEIKGSKLVSLNYNERGRDFKRSQIENEVREKNKNRADSDGEDDTKYLADSVSGYLINKLASDPNARRTRAFFRDYAYWIPNLRTGKNGKTAFEVTYPDNITGWQTWVPAMDGKRHSGLGELTVNSFKPVSFNFALPAFITENDQLFIKSKLLNYTGKPVNGNYYLNTPGEKRKQGVNIDYVWEDSALLTAEKAGDTLWVEGGFEMNNGYRDAERRNLPVNAATVVSGKSRFFELSKDTVLNFKPDSADFEMNIAVYNHKLALVMEILKELDNMRIAGNQFAANRLDALLTVKKASEILKLPFDKEEELKTALKNLKNSQNKDGSFGYFSKSSGNLPFTRYCAGLLFKAQEQGYDNNVWLNASRYMDRQVRNLNGDEKVATLLVLHQLGRDIEYDTLLKGVKKENLSASGKLDLLLLLQSMKRNPSLAEVREKLESAEDGSIRYAGSFYSVYDVYYDRSALTYKAWLLFYNAKTEVKMREKMVDYLSSGAEMHCHNRAMVADAMLKQFSENGGLQGGLIPRLKSNGKDIQTSQLPLMSRLKPGETLVLEHKDAPVFVALNHKFRTYKPLSDSGSFEISCEWPAQMEPGKNYEVKIKVKAKRNFNGVVIDVPIPAGCGFAEKLSFEQFFESEREYRADRMIVQAETMPFGSYTFTMKLRARYAGNFNAAPARAGLQFYPDKSAYTKPLKMIIR